MKSIEKKKQIVEEITEKLKQANQQSWLITAV